MSVAEPQLRESIEEILPGVIADRRYLHQHPELGYEERITSQLVVDRLTAIGAEEIQTGIAETGVTAIIRGTAASGRPTRTVLLRADMDALPIEEQNDVEYRSTISGKMHACGHDAHVSILLGAARILAEQRQHFDGTVKVLFQPAEEGGGGAMRMIDEGVMNDPPIDATFGLHIWQHAALGTIEAREGVAMVGADGFTIRLQGKGGHGAKPSISVDPIVVGSLIVNALQTLVSRETDPTMPAVVTVGAFQAGSAFNVIPDTAVMRGTLRFVSEEQRAELYERLRAVVTGIAEPMGATAEVSIEYGVSALVNDPEMTRIVKSAAAKVVGEVNVVDGPLKSVSEDYGEFSKRAPGCFFFLGSRNEERGLTWGHHHPRFDVDEAALAIGIETMTRTVLDYFDNE
jgi:amidohydrolase